MRLGRVWGEIVEGSWGGGLAGIWTRALARAELRGDRARLRDETFQGGDASPRTCTPQGLHREWFECQGLLFREVSEVP